MSIDPLFPFPEPDILWVYELIHTATAASLVATDDDGRWTSTGPSLTTVGYVAAPDNKAYRLAEVRGVQVDAVALVPRGFAVAVGDLIDVPSTVPMGLPGRYRVNLVRPNPSHTRLLIERWESIPLANAP